MINGKPVNPGEFRTQITVKKRAVMAGAGGFRVPSPGDTIGTVWAKWVNVHGSEAWTAAGQSAIRAATVTIRYLANVDESCLILKGSDYFEIVSMDDIQERHEYIELKVKKVVVG